MNNRSMNHNSSRLNKSTLNKSKNTSFNQQQQQQQQDSISQAWNEIESIRKENKLLKDEIDIETKLVKNNNTNEVSRVQKDEQSLLQIERIQNESSNLATLIELESKKYKDLSILLTKSKEEISENQVKLSGADGNTLPQLQSKIKSQEYQLEKIRGRQNESLAQINMLKEQLNMVRRERVIFSNVFKKLEQDLKKKDEEFKKYILERMKEDQRKQQAEDDFVKTKQWAQEEIKRKQEQYDEALLAIEEDIENERIRIYDNKNQQTFETEVPNQKQEKTIVKKMNNSPKKMNTNLQKSTTSNLQTTEEEVEHFKFIFNKLKRETGVETIDEFIDQYKQINQINDELYDKCNQKSDKILEITKKIKAIDEETQKLLNTDDDTAKVESQKTTEQNKANRTKRAVLKVNKSNRKMQKDIKTINVKVEKLAELIKVPLPEEGLNEKNSTKFISLIEQKISDIINMAEFCNEEIKDIERKIKPKNVSEKEKDINECLDTHEKNKEAERIKSRRDLEEIAFEAIRDFNKKKKIR